MDAILRHVILVIALYFFLLMSFCGWGFFCSVILKLTIHIVDGFFFPVVWLGWSATLGLFQFFHLFLPLDWKVSVFVYGLGGLFFAYVAIIKLKVMNSLARMTRLLFFGVILLGVAVWLSYRGLSPIQHYDSGLYYLSSMRWINSYPIVLGLGNLHGRLAFNQSFFVYAASLNFFPLFPYAHSTANGFLFLLTFGEMLWHVLQIIYGWRETSLSSVYSYMPYFAGLLLSALWGAVNTKLGAIGYSFDVNSPSPDMASSLIQLVLFVWFIKIVVDYRERKLSTGLVPVVFFLTFSLVTIKISNLFFAVTLSGVCLFFAIRLFTWKYLLRKDFLLTLALMVVIGLVWVIRGYCTSGYPLYPAGIGGLQVDWAIPIENVTRMSDIIYSWARMPHYPPHEVLGNWQWLKPWALRIYQDYKPTVIFPLFFSFALIFSSFIGSIFQGRVALFYSDLVFFIPIMSGIVAWFFTVPDPRFAHAVFYLFLFGAVVTFSACFYGIAESKMGVLVGRVSVFTFTVTSVFFLILIPCSSIASNFYNEYSRIPLPVLKEMQTETGLMLLMPTTSDQCWDAPLPCTPIFYPKLRLRKDGDLSSGFTVK